MRSEQFFLALDAQFGQQDMPAVTQQLIVIHGSGAMGVA